MNFMNITIASCFLLAITSTFLYATAACTAESYKTETQSALNIQPDCGGDWYQPHNCSPKNK